MRNLGDARMVDARGGLTQAGKQFRGVLEIHLDEVTEAIAHHLKQFLHHRLIHRIAQALAHRLCHHGTFLHGYGCFRGG